MKISESIVVKIFNSLATVALVVYLLIMVVLLFTSASPKNSQSVKTYSVFGITVNSKKPVDEDPLKIWFGNRIIVQNVPKARVDLRLKNYGELFSKEALAFQAGYLLYWLSIGGLILAIKIFFRSLKRNQVFTGKNLKAIMAGAAILIILPTLRWISVELFINWIEFLKINDSGYTLSNTNGFFGEEMIFGFVVMAFGLVFKIGVDIKEENESFV